ncbi:von Willebrand factor type A domain protein [Micromonospora sp. MW-13]|uniref:vWA domain-containing protein n=1 Tax=unclassified Micromonospora TaxID=2617518 RepID=UPI000E448FE3|nr:MULTISPECIES: extracellular solute-binding protein [unclassified Micromonospora]MCX4471077.1 substrate-binding and VWA domain-containing protein [Micromonospora sp. NBC_01655]RGC67077.1 von Willebrand factor type A domain protein [Micromonospora sp. MW-13]
MATGQPSARPWLPYTVAVVAGLAVIAAAYLLVRPTPGADRSSCVALEVNSSTEKDLLLGQLAARYNDSDRRFGGRCAQVSVHGLNSGKAMEALAGGWAGRQPAIPAPQVWLPTSSLWTGRLRVLDEKAGRPARITEPRYPSIANSPLVIAMPREKGELVQQRGPLGWEDILGLSGDAGWATFGRPEWGRFTFGKDNPNLSTSGLAATIATYYAAVQRSSDLIEEDLAKPNVTQFVRRIEANVSHYSDDSVDLLRDLAEADLGGAGDARTRDMSAVVVQEELVYQYNQGQLSPTPGTKPRVPLVAVHPKEGTFNLDHPYVVLPSADEAQRAAAQDFLTFLQDAPQQRSFADLGFRDHERRPSDELVAAVRGGSAGELTYFDPPEPEVVDAILRGWSTLRKKANILFAVDVSGSMTKKVGGRSRLQVATGAAGKAVGLLNSADQVALWSFSSETEQRPKTPYGEEIRLAPFNQAGFTRKLAGLRAAGNTALYATVRAAHRQLLEDYDPDRINAVVVLTDGKNEYPKDNDLARLLKDIALDPERPVKVFCVAFDQESDLASLDKIAKASAGKAFDATDPATIDEAFVKLVSSF